MANIKTSRSRGTAIATVLIILAVLAIVAAKAFSGDVVQVRVAEVNHQNLLSTISTNGKVEPVEQYPAHAVFAAVIKKIYVQVGQKVKAGQLLIQMDDAFAESRLTAATAGLRAAENTASDVEHNGTQDERIGMTADLARFQAQQKQATSDVETLRTLQAKGAASAAEVAAAEQRLANANASIQTLQQRSTDRFSSAERMRAQAQLADARATLAAGKRNYGNVRIRTPIDGTVYSLPVSEYDFVPAGEDMLDIADLNHIQVRAYFDEPDIGKLARGQAVKIIWDAKPNQTWHGHIERAPTTIMTYGTRNVGECLITVDDAHGDLLPNTNVNVTVTTAQRFNVLSIPREALHTEGSNNFVYRVVAGKLVRTPVQVGLLNLTRVEVTGGLTAKDTIALSATSNRDLSPGLAVKVAE